MQKVTVCLGFLNAGKRPRSPLNTGKKNSFCEGFAWVLQPFNAGYSSKLFGFPGLGGERLRAAGGLWQEAGMGFGSLFSARSFRLALPLWLGTPRNRYSSPGGWLLGVLLCARPSTFLARNAAHFSFRDGEETGQQPSFPLFGEAPSCFLWVWFPT